MKSILQLCNNKDWTDLLIMEEKLAQMTGIIVYQIRDNEDRKPQLNLVQHWKTLAARYLQFQKSTLPTIEREIKDEDLCQILSGKGDSILTIFNFIRALCNYTNDILNNDGVASTILWVGKF